MGCEYPYTDEVYGNIIVRRFSKHVPIGDLTWCTCNQNNKVKVIKGQGWQLQFDNQNPTELQEGEIILIPQKTYHRLLRGYTDLILEITTSN